MTSPLRTADRWATFATVILTIVLLAVAARVAQLQLYPGDNLLAHMGARVSQVELATSRGDLLDRRGRLLATSRTGHRAFVDPVAFAAIDPAERDERLAEIAEAVGAPAGALRERVRSRLEANQRRARGQEDAPPIRFVAISDVLTERRVQRVRELKIPGLHLQARPVRESVAGEVAAALVGKVGFEHEGRLGAEYALNDDLDPQSGTLHYLRDSAGRPLWVEPDQWKPGEPGADVRLSIDLQLQRICHEELMRGIEDADAAGGRLIMIDPATGEVLAMLDLVREVEGLVEYPWADKDAPPGPGLPEPGPDAPRYVTLPPDPGREIHPALARNRCVEDIYEPGSTFKPFVWAAVTELGLARSDEVFDTHGGRWRLGRRAIEDVTRRMKMTWDEVLVNSSNIGMVKGSGRLSHKQLHDALVRFGFGRQSGIDLPGEAAGMVTPLSRWGTYTHTSVAFGHEVAVTPVQMVRAFAAFARTGAQAGTLPQLHVVALDDAAPDHDLLHRVMPPGVAIKVRYVLAEVASKMEAVMKSKDPSETGWRYRIFGKSGTAEIPLGRPPEGKRLPTGARGYYEEQYNSSFIAGGPLEHPRLVVLVVIDDPGPRHVWNHPFRTHYGSHVAGPVARRVLERSLAYLGVPPSDPDLQVDIARVEER